MPEHTELQAGANFPIPILRRARVLSDCHGEVMRAIEETQSPAEDASHQTACDSVNGTANLRRSISHRISRVATTTLGRSLTELRRPRSASQNGQSCVQRGGAELGYSSDTRIRKVHGSDDSRRAGRALRAATDARAFPAWTTVIQLSPVKDSPTHTHDSAIMQTEAADRQDGKGLLDEVPVPAVLQQGVPMTKVSAGSQKSYVFKLDADQGQIIWESKKLRIIPIENIKELRSGSDARYYRQQFQLAREYENRWITIIYILDGQYKTLHLIASSLDTFRLWDITLRKLYAIRQELMTGPGKEEMRHAVWTKQCWKSAGEQNDHRLSFEQVETLCRRLNINSSREDLMRLFRSADSQNHHYLDFSDFQTFVKLLKARPEIDLLYKKFCSMNNGKFTFNMFHCFMRDTQESSLTRDELENLFVRYSTKTPGGRDASSKPNLASLTMSLDAFSAFLLSSDNSAFTGQSGKVYQPMTYPLSDYFISSSHNTYLVGNQLVGYSTVEGYIRALLHSCRSVELDIYDGECEPMVFHGKTLTSKVTVHEVCEAIMKYAFVTSPYPIIISAEIHCSVPQQDMLANILHEVFGQALVSAPFEGNPLSGPLPSPEDLKGRILLKAKNLYVSEGELICESDTSIDTESSSTETSASDSDIAQEIKDGLRKAKPREAKVRMSAALVALLVYTVGVKYRGINKKEHYAPEHMFSLSETRANRILKQGAADLIKHNKTHLVRTYPRGTRINSTNYLPHRFWAVGAQLVAINWQTFDMGYMINHAMFQRNGRAGYVLKPEVLRKSEDPRKPEKQHLHHHKQYYLEVTVISAQQLPRPKDAMGHEIMDKYVDPYVEVSIHTPDWTHPSNSSSFLSPPSSPTSPNPSTSHVHAHRSVTTMRTSSVKNNGFNPVWQETLRLPFEVVGDMHDLVFVRFTIQRDWESDGEPIAVYCISLGSLAMGYRHLPLHDPQVSQYLFSTLFVRCSVRDA